MNGETPGADEPVGRLLLEHDRRDGAEVLAVLDLVEPGLHLGVDRRGEDRARPQRPRAELHPALEPADDLVLRQDVGGLAGDVVEPAIGELGPAEELLDLVVAVTRAEEGVVHAVGPRGRRRARGRRPRGPRPGRCRRRRRPAAPRCRRNGPRSRSRAFITQLSATPPAMQRSVAAGRCVQPARQLEHRLLEHDLERVGDVVVALLERAAALRGPGRSAPPAGAARWCTARRARAGRSRGTRRRNAGLPYEASAITLYSSDECRKPR